MDYDHGMNDTHGGIRHKDGHVGEWTHAGQGVQDTRIPDNVIRITRHKARGINGNGFGVSLSEAATEWMAPQVPNGGRSTAHAEQVGQTLYHNGKKVTSVAHQAMLCNQAASFRPPSSPAQPIAGGSMSLTDSPNSNQPSVKRKLNPIFVEALMRWPTGLSGFERQEMAWTRWWLLMPSFLSQLCSQPEGVAQMDLFGEAA